MTDDDEQKDIREPLPALSPERMGPNKIFGFRTALAEEQEFDGHTVTMDTSIGLGGIGIFLAVKGPGGTRVSEHIDLRPMLNAWAGRVIEEMKASQAAADAEAEDAES